MAHVGKRCNGSDACSTARSPGEHIILMSDRELQDHEKRLDAIYEKGWSVNIVRTSILSRSMRSPRSTRLDRSVPVRSLGKARWQVGKTFPRSHVFPMDTARIIGRLTDVGAFLVSVADHSQPEKEPEIKRCRHATDDDGSNFCGTKCRPSYPASHGPT